MDSIEDHVSPALNPTANFPEEQLVPLFRAFQALHCLTQDEFAALQKQELDQLKIISYEKEHWLTVARHLLSREKTLELLAFPPGGYHNNQSYGRLARGIRAQGDRMRDLLVINQAVTARDLMLAAKTKSLIQRQGDALSMSGVYETGSQSGVLRYLQDQVDALQGVSCVNDSLLVLIHALVNHSDSQSSIT